MRYVNSFGVVTKSILEEALSLPAGGAAKLIRRYDPYFGFRPQDYDNKIYALAEQIGEIISDNEEIRDEIEEYENALLCDVPVILESLAGFKITELKQDIKNGQLQVDSLKREIQKLKAAKKVSMPASNQIKKAG